MTMKPKTTNYTFLPPFLIISNTAVSIRFLVMNPIYPKLSRSFGEQKNFEPHLKLFKKKKKSPPHHSVFPVLGHIPTEASYACDLRNGLHPCPGRSAWARPGLGRKLGVSTHCHLVCPIFHTIRYSHTPSCTHPISRYIQIPPAKTLVWIEAARRQ